VKKTTAQLEKLLQVPGVVALEVDVDRILSARAKLAGEVLDSAATAHARGATPVIYTSRVERQFPDQASRLAFGEAGLGLLMDGGARPACQPGLSHAQAADRPSPGPRRR